jgi:hypothetical protein
LLEAAAGPGIRAAAGAPSCCGRAAHDPAPQLPAAGKAGAEASEAKRAWGGTNGVIEVQGE